MEDFLVKLYNWTCAGEVKVESNSEEEMHNVMRIKHCVKFRNFTQFPGVEILWKGAVSVQFWAIRPNLFKLITVFFAVEDGKQESQDIEGENDKNTDIPNP